MAWESRRIEETMKAALAHQLGPSGAESFFALYVRARDKIAADVLPAIPAAQPGLTDHTQAHIENVLDNCYYLLGEPNVDTGILSGVEWYLLCLAVLFHDVGNVYEREGHEKRVAQVYDWVRGGDSGIPVTESMIIVRVCGAHTGKSRDGSRDTIGALPSTMQFAGKFVRPREIAAILRLADELAEGPQRTYSFMHEIRGYPKKSMIHHDYAKITDVAIDRGNERLALTYKFSMKRSGISSADIVAQIKKLLKYTFDRIGKLDQERQYNRFYSKALEPFKFTSIQIDFWLDGENLDWDLPSLQLSDMRVPGEKTKQLREHNKEYDVELICNKLTARLEAS